MSYTANPSAPFIYTVGGDRAAHFDEDAHEYWLLHGTSRLKVPSTTQIIKRLGMFPESEWIDPFYLERGSALHKAIEYDIEGDLDEETLHEAVRPKFDCYKRLADVIGGEPEVVAAEIRIIDTVNHSAGTIDMLCRIGEILWLLDWKSGGVYNSSRLQVYGSYLPKVRALIRESGEELGLRPSEADSVRCAVVSLSGEQPKFERPRGNQSQWQVLFESATRTLRLGREMGFYQGAR